MTALTFLAPLFAVFTVIVGILAVRNAVRVNRGKHAPGGTHRDPVKAVYG